MLIDKKLNIENSENTELLPVIETFSGIQNENHIEIVNINNLSIEPVNNNNKNLPEKLHNDFNNTNKTLKECIEINLTALRLISQSLSNTPYEPRIGEVLARLLESMTDLNQQYMNSYKQFTEIFKNIENIQNGNNDNTNTPINIQNAAIFTGTLKDLINKIPENPI